MKHFAKLSLCLMAFLLTISAVKAQTTLDDFSDGNYTSNPQWTVKSGTWEVNTGSLQNTATTSRISTPFTIACDLWQFDYSFETTSGSQIIRYFFMMTADNSDPGGTTTDGYYVYITGTDGDISLRKIENGYPTNLLTWDGTASTSWHTVKITRNCINVFELFVDGSSKGSVSDNTFAPSSCAYQGAWISSASSNDNNRIDNIIYNQIALGTTGPTGPTGADGATNGWSLLGNAGTSEGTNFLGTTDYTGFKIKTNNTERMFIGSDGKVGIGRAAQVQLFEVYDSQWPAYGRFGNNNGYTEIGYNSSHAIIESSNDLLINYYLGKNVTIGGQNSNEGTLTTNHSTFLAQQDGKVGIGTIEPSEKLEVNGNIKSLSPDNNNVYSILMPVDLRFHRDEIDGNGRAYISNTGTNGSLAFTTNGPGTAENIRMFISGSGNVGIGTLNPTYPLAVNGTIRAKEIIVETNWSDFVFYNDYKLKTIYEVEQFIKANKHLPGVPSAADVAKNGISLGQSDSILLMKIEELTLYLIEQNKLLIEAQQKIKALEEKAMFKR